MNLTVCDSRDFIVYSKLGLCQTGEDVKGSTVNECMREAAVARKSGLKGNDTPGLTHVLFSLLIN